MGDENETAAFDVTPQKTMTCGRMLSILVYMIGTVICEMIFDKLIVLALLVLVPVCIAAMRVQEKKRGLSVCGRTISVKGKTYSADDITAVRVTALGNVYIYFDKMKCRIHVSFNHYDRFCKWAGEHGIRIPDQASPR
ncbi:MAG: hypothetical protein IK130_09830 [Oscillospiraceae bacterium]|nr:hypothetical protein [Oscillospiraceae bacterium]